MEAIKARIINGIDEGLRQWELLHEIHASDYNENNPNARMAHQIFRKARDWQDSRKTLLQLIRAAKRQASYFEEKMTGNDLVGASYFKTNTPNSQKRIEEEAARLEEIESDLIGFFWIIDLSHEQQAKFFDAIRVPEDEA